MKNNRLDILHALTQLIPGRTTTYERPGSYHEKAQQFIKSSHAQGRDVKAEGSELIASKPGTYMPKKQVQIEALKNKMIPRQYGDKKYVPSNGTGVGG